MAESVWDRQVPGVVVIFIHVLTIGVLWAITEQIVVAIIGWLALLLVSAWLAGPKKPSA